jgi:hypothetical protein
LYGEVAREFLERAAQAKCSKTKEEVRESMRKAKAIFAKFNMNNYA